MKKIAFITVFMILMSLSAQTPVLVEQEAEYIMSDGETPFFAEIQSFEKAKRYALEKAGVYVSSRTEVKNYTDVTTEIEALTGGFMRVEVLQEKRYYNNVFDMVFYTKVRAVVDLSDVDEIREFLANKRLINEYAAMKEDYSSILLEMENLKRELETAKKTNNRLLQIALSSKLAKKAQSYQARIVYEEASKDVRKVSKEKKVVEGRLKTGGGVKIVAGPVKVGQGVGVKPVTNVKTDNEQQELLKHKAELDNREKKCEEMLQLASQLDEDFVDPILKLSEIETGRGKKDNAKKLVEKAMKVNPIRAQSLMNVKVVVPVKKQ